VLQSRHHSEYPRAELLARKEESVSVVFPAREVAGTVGPCVEAALSLGELVDQVLVVDAASKDGSAEIARAAGAEVVQEADLRPELGPVLGKGDAMWRALSAARGDLVVYVDSDSVGFPPHFVSGLAAPLITGEADFVKGAYRRPFVSGGIELADGGGRVTELCARPLLRALFPDLAEFRQPLAGEIAGRRSLLESLSFVTGYGAEIAMLIDVWREVGIERMAQVDIGERRQPHQPLQDLGSMADAVLATVLDRAGIPSALSAPLGRA
jgi:glucosyl-3-phosphoglycerate synthase